MSMVATRDLEEICVQKLAARLRIYRLRTGWSLEELAERAGVSRSTLHHLEHGTTPHPRLLTLHRLAKAFGVDVEHLVSPGTGEGPAEPGATFDPLHARSGGFSPVTPAADSESAPLPRLFPNRSCQGSLGAPLGARNSPQSDGGSHDGAELPRGGRTRACGGEWDEGWEGRELAGGLAEHEPGLFRDWTRADWALWESRVASLGEVGLVRLREAAREVNRHRETRLQLQAVLNSPLAGVATQLIQTLFETACQGSAAGPAPPA